MCSRSNVDPAWRLIDTRIRTPLQRTSLSNIKEVVGEHTPIFLGRPFRTRSILCNFAWSIHQIYSKYPWCHIIYPSSRRKSPAQSVTRPPYKPLCQTRCTCSVLIYIPKTCHYIILPLRRSLITFNVGLLELSQN